MAEYRLYWTDIDNAVDIIVLEKYTNSYKHLPCAKNRKYFPNYSVVESVIFSGKVTTKFTSGSPSALSARIYVSGTYDDTSYKSAPYCTDIISMSQSGTVINTGDISNVLFPNSGNVNAGYIGDNSYIHIRCHAEFSSSKSTTMTNSFDDCEAIVTYEPPTVDVRTDIVGNGTVTGGSVLTLAKGDTEYSTTLVATPAQGYKFLKWSDGNTSQTRTITYTDNDISATNTQVTYTAEFEPDKINEIYIGTSQPKSIYIGTSEVKSVYVGTTKVYG